MDTESNELQSWKASFYMAGVWSLDFARKIFEMSFVRRWLFRLICGRYAFREFMGLCKALEQGGRSMYFGYGLEDVDYHKDKISWKDFKQL